MDESAKRKPVKRPPGYEIVPKRELLRGNRKDAALENRDLALLVKDTEGFADLKEKISAELSSEKLSFKFLGHGADCTSAQLPAGGKIEVGEIWPMVEAVSQALASKDIITGEFNFRYDRVLSCVFLSISSVAGEKFDIKNRSHRDAVCHAMGAICDTAERLAKGPEVVK